jgi:hypothetical protein
MVMHGEATTSQRQRELDKIGTLLGKSLAVAHQFLLPWCATTSVPLLTCSSGAPRGAPLVSLVLVAHLLSSWCTTATSSWCATGTIAGAPLLLLPGAPLLHVFGAPLVEELVRHRYFLLVHHW